MDIKSSAFKIDRNQYHSQKKVTQMIQNKAPMFFYHRNKSANKHPYIRFTVVILLFLFLLTEATAGSGSEKDYLRIEKNRPAVTDDLEITSIGALILKENMVGHVNLSSMKSVKHGDAVAFDMGGGFAFNWDVSLFLGFGISLGYNTDNDEIITAYYPEAGIVIDITNTFGITVSTKRFHHLYEENDDIVMMGLVFRN